MRGFLIVGALIGAGLLGGFAPVGTRFDFWKTGEGNLSYHRLAGDCGTLTHSFGRNAVWGLWLMPLAEVDVAVVPAVEGSGARMVFTCKAGAECIRAGAYRTTDGWLAAHRLPFGSLERAQLFEATISGLRLACATSPASDAARPSDTSG